MPRSVDKEARRRAVVDALFRIAAREGLDGVSMRTVASEAGFSLGALQRYFTSKDEMLHFAFDQAVDVARARLGEVTLAPARDSFAEGLRDSLTQYLPRDEQRLAEARIWAAFYAEAAIRPDFAEQLCRLDDEARADLRRAIDAAQAAGELPAHHDPAALADLILVLLDGLWWHAVRQPPGASLAQQRAAIDAAVALLR